MLFFDTYELCLLLRKNKSIISNSPLGKNSLSCHLIMLPEVHINSEQLESCSGQSRVYDGTGNN